MFSAARTLTNQMARRAPAFQAVATRGFAAPKLGDVAKDAHYAWKKSCYSGMDYTIDDNATVYEAVEKFAAYGVGCLVTKDAEGEFLVPYAHHTSYNRSAYYGNLIFNTHEFPINIGKLSGIVSERDYVKKVGLLEKSSKDIKVKEISTKVENLVIVRPDDTVDSCMQKMLGSDIRHLPLVDEMGEVVGIVSIKDLIKSVMEEKEQTIESLASFAVGEGGHFVM